MRASKRARERENKHNRVLLFLISFQTLVLAIILGTGHSLLDWLKFKVVSKEYGRECEKKKANKDKANKERQHTLIGINFLLNRSLPMFWQMLDSIESEGVWHTTNNRWGYDLWTKSSFKLSWTKLFFSFFCLSPSPSSLVDVQT